MSHATFAIRARGLELTDELRAHVMRRLYFALSRVSPRLRRVDVTLEDVNGPRGGVDKVCRVRLRGAGLDDVIVDDRDRDIAVAVDLAASRAARTALRAIAIGRLPRRAPRSDPDQDAVTRTPVTAQRPRRSSR